MQSLWILYTNRIQCNKIHTNLLYWVSQNKTQRRKRINFIFFFVFLLKFLSFEHQFGFVSPSLSLLLWVIVPSLFKTRCNTKAHIIFFFFIRGPVDFLIFILKFIFVFFFSAICRCFIIVYVVVRIFCFLSKNKKKRSLSNRTITYMLPGCLAMKKPYIAGSVVVAFSLFS